MNLIALLWEELERMVNKSISVHQIKPTCGRSLKKSEVK